MLLRGQLGALGFRKSCCCCCQQLGPRVMTEQSTTFPPCALLNDGEAWEGGSEKVVRVLGTQAQKSDSPGFLASALPPDRWQV